MSQIEELQSRITAAMERIGTGVLALSAAADTAAEAQANAEADAATNTALEEERLVNAQLQERLKRLKARHAEELAAAQDVGAAAEEPAADPALDDELAGLKAELETLQTEAAKVEALQAELAEAKLMLDGAEQSETLKAELEAAQARLADTSEADALRAEIDDLQTRLDESAELGSVRADLEGSDAGADTEALKSDLATLKTEYQVQADAMTALDVDMQRLRKSNDQLRDVITVLREANAAGLGDPSLINAAMLAELEGLRATRASDVTEAGAVLARLEPLLAQAANLPAGEDE